MAKIIGPASDFYRLRITHLDLTDDLEFDWRDDVLWRSPPTERLEEQDVWLVEVVTVDGAEVVRRLAAYDDPDDARDFVSGVEEDLAELTKSQFESVWLGSSPDDGEPTLNGR